MDEPDPERGTTRLHELVRRALVAANRVILRAIDRATPSEQNRLFGLTLVVGAVCGLAAVAFHHAIGISEKLFLTRALHLVGWKRVAALVAMPTAGALVAGIYLQRFAPDARGSGIPQVKWTYAAQTGQLRLRDGASKFVVGALQIGTGASLGREGPTVQICASVASALGRLFALSPSNRRRLIPVGAAAGIAAAFNAPIAAVTFVIEELVGGLDTTVLSGVVVAAALSAVVERSFSGENPVLDVPGGYRLAHSSSLLVFAILGLVAGLAGYGFSRGLLDLRQKLREQKLVPGWAQPAVGGLVTGVLAAVALETSGTLGVAGGGYETLTFGLHGGLVFKVMAILCVAKFGATIFSYSTGGCGGIFAPVLFVGAMLGGLFASADHYALGHADAETGAFALVGMGAFFAAVIRAPITSILIIFEMTGSYRLVLPLMVANATAYYVARAFNPTPIYDALLEQDGLKIPHGSQAASTLAAIRVSDVMVTNPITLDVRSTVAQAVEKIADVSFAAFPVVGADGVLFGMIGEARLRRLDADGRGGDELGEHVQLREYAREGQTLREVLGAMQRLGIRQLCVVDDTRSRRVVGVVAMSDVIRALLRSEDRRDVPPAPSSSRRGAPLPSPSLRDAFGPSRHP